jgi:P27 family predicted phage terminase small subunit
MSGSDRRAPKHLSTEARAFWTQIVTEWAIDDAGALIRLVACECLDRLRGAQQVIKREGMTVKGRAHPATVIERDARLALLRARRQLGLDLEPVRDHPGRPAGR